MKRLTRKARILIVITLFIAFLGGLLWIFWPKEKPVNDVTYSTKLVAENQDIKSTYIDPVSIEKSSQQYQKCDIVVEQGTKIKDYKISKKQIFSKYLQLKGPDGKETLRSKSSQQATHYAYTMLLTGDILEKTNDQTQQKTYEIVNARITYQCIPLILLANENSVNIVNQDKTKEKVVNLEEFKKALNDVSKRDTMLSW